MKGGAVSRPAAGRDPTRLGGRNGTRVIVASPLSKARWDWKSLPTRVDLAL